MDGQYQFVGGPLDGKKLDTQATLPELWHSEHEFGVSRYTHTYKRRDLPHGEFPGNRYVYLGCRKELIHA